MIGEDFRSRASENLIYARELEQRIEILNEEIKGLKAKVDDRELELVIQGRVKESYMMEGEELLTHFDTMRQQKEHFNRLYDQQASLALERQSTIEQITADFAEKERKRLDCKEDKDTQTFIGAKYFEQKKQSSQPAGNST